MEFTSSPNGTILNVMNTRSLMSKEIMNKSKNSVLFFYVDVDVLNKYYGGALEAVFGLKKYAGVKSVRILPLEGRIDYDKYDELLSTLLTYV